MRALLKWLAEPVLVVGSFVVVLGCISLVNGGQFRAPATLAGAGENIAEQAESIPAPTALAGTPGSTLAFVRRAEGPQPASPADTSAHRDHADVLEPLPEPEPVLGILFDDAWLLLLAGIGILCMGRGLRLMTSNGPIPRSA